MRGRRRRPPACGAQWGPLHQELKKPGVTLTLLWQVSRAGARRIRLQPVLRAVRRWARTLKPSMRQVHRAGEKLFVDFSGKRPHLVDPQTGEAIAVELFVGVLGASLIYAEATHGVDLASCGAHVRMLDYFQSAGDLGPGQFERAASRRRAATNRGEPHYDRRPRPPLWRGHSCPVSPRRPTNQSRQCVQIAQRWILAVLRHRTFFTLADLNAAIAERVDAINERPMQITGVSRRALFTQLDRPALMPLPRTRYELAEWKPCRVNIDYHVEVDPQLLQRAVATGARPRRARSPR